MDLFNQLQASLTGSQLGNNAMQGMAPSPVNPRGAPQLSIAAIGKCRSLIADMNAFADALRRSGDEDNDKRIIDCTRKLQEVLDNLKKKQADAQQNQM